MGAVHNIADSQQLPFEDETFDAIATEPPYHPDGGVLISKAIEEMVRVLKPECKVAIYSAEWQVEHLHRQAKQLAVDALLDLSIDRKSSDCHLSLWRKRHSLALMI